MSTVVPTHEQLAAFVTAAGDRPDPVVMLNLLRFGVDRGDGDADGGAPSAGAAEYQRYADQAVAMVAETGGRVLWLGRVDQVFIGDDDRDGWDAVALVEYPSRSAFLDMVARPDYQAAHHHREAGLAATALLACTPLPGGPTNLS